MNIGLIIIGTGGHAVSVTNVALSAGYSVFSYVDDKKAGGQFLGIPIVATEFAYSTYPRSNYAIGIGDNAVRERVATEIKAILPLAPSPRLVHQSSAIGVGCSIGIGTVVMPNSNIGPNSIVGDFCIINTNSSIDHDCSLADFSSMAPGAITGGYVKIGFKSAVSIGATIKHNINVGNDTVIGASSYVNKDVADGVIAFGVPCRTVRNRNPGEQHPG